MGSRRGPTPHYKEGSWGLSVLQVLRDLLRDAPGADGLTPIEIVLAVAQVYTL
jgi:hypothetical protein